MARGWYEFVTRSIMPTTNKSEVNTERSMLVHSIIIGEDIQVDEIIADQIYKFTKKTDLRAKLPFPGVVKRLCNRAKASVPDDTLIPVEGPIDGKMMMRVKGARQAPPPPPQQEEEGDAEMPQAPQVQQGVPSNFMDIFNNVMAAMQLQNMQRWDAFQQRYDANQEHNRKSFSDINTRLEKMDHQLNFLCNINQFMNEDFLYPYQQTELTMRDMQGRGIPVTIDNLKINRQREEEMRIERQIYQRIIEEAAAQRAKEQNKGKEAWESKSKECLVT
ncbi:hypothetical protein PIB30_076367 [Stylosanthes scabra]|uniref:Putative plant transposon protein domain-containing protein n=1 Tax=Stylosanthes scabra TaxID=79078 RepID=A0ABU6XQJ8_9FABA|nr:hypothetical protein [Stylosanthes scabra]